MGSNNVREKAEAAYDALDMREKSEIAAQHPRYCYAKGYTAALAVAPATAQPVAYICVECGALWRKVRLPGDADESWNMISVKGCAGCDNGPKPLLDALYREPLPAPATVDAAAVRGAVRRIVRDAARAGAIDAPDDKNYSGFTENDASRCAERVLESMEDDIAALPLPAPATRDIERSST